MRRFLVFISNILDIPKRIFSHISLLCILQDTIIDRTAAICSGVRLYRSKLGKYSYIGTNSFVSDTSIGNFTSISQDCYIGGATHPIYWVSTSPVFHKWDNVMKKNFAKHEFDIFQKTYIGNDVWIGNGVKIKAGVKISDGAIIGMGSVVTKNVGPYEIWGGNPAVLIKKRFDEDVIERIMKTEWWNMDDRKIEEYAIYFKNPDLFLEEIK